MNMKKYLMGFILGTIITGTFVMAATKIGADKIYYNDNVTVKDKIDNLYTKVKPTYNGEVSITPTRQEQILLTNGKVLNNNITVAKIPDELVDVSLSTITSTEDITEGKKAYKADGTLITGTGTSFSNTQTVELWATTASNSQQGRGVLNSTCYYYQAYKYFKIKELITKSSPSVCTVAAYSIDRNSTISINTNQRYNNGSTTDGYNFCSITVHVRASNNGVDARCQAIIEFYN